MRSNSDSVGILITFDFAAAAVTMHLPLKYSKKTLRSMAYGAQVEPLEEHVLGQIATNKNHFTLSFLVLAPGLGEVAAHHHVHALEHHAAVLALHVEHA